MRLTISLILTLTIISTCCFGQREIDHWFFSSSTRVRFDNGSIINQPPPNAGFGSGGTSLSDKNGNLLFASSGGMVYDRNMNRMPALVSNFMNYNGGNVYTAPVPGHATRHYIFYNANTFQNTPYTVRYAIVDLSLNGGLGDVITYDNIVDTILSQGFTLVKKKGTEDFWVVTHRAKTDSFFSHPVTSTGISAPVVSRTGQHPYTTEYNFVDFITSHDGTMLAGAAYTFYNFSPFPAKGNFLEIFNFNSSTGAVTSKVVSRRNFQFGDYAAKLEFSPDNRLLYTVDPDVILGLQPCDFAVSSIWQYNLCYTDSVSFTQHSVYLGNSPSYRCQVLYWGNAQMGPDKKIYIPFINTTTLSRIDHPNRIGTSCTINQNAHTFPGGNNGIAPSFYHDYVEKAVKNNIVYEAGCFPAPHSFHVTNDTITTINWDFGDPTSGTNTSALLRPQHTYSASGIYTVTATLYNSNGQLIETLTEQLEVKDPNRRILYNYPEDTSFCQGEVLHLRPDVINGIFIWGVRQEGYPVGYYSYSIPYQDINSSGIYYVKMVQNGCNGCEMIDSIKVTIKPVPYVNFGNDRNLCTGDSLQLNASNTNASYIWSTGATTSSIWVYNAGTYWVKAEINNNGCPKSDTIVITEVPSPDFQFPAADTVLCNNQTLLLSPGVANAFYTWQNGSGNNSFTVTGPGKYWVRLGTANGCVRSDTIEVSYVNAENVSLGADTSLCIGAILPLSTTVANADYLWNTGEVTQDITVTTDGDYWIKVDNGACTVSDTIKVAFYPKPPVAFGPDVSLCESETLTLDATVAGSQYLWQDNSINPSFTISQAGLYWVQVTKNNCSNRDSINVVYKPKPLLSLGADAIICENETLQLNAFQPSIRSYLWQDNSTQSTYQVTSAGTYHVTVTGHNDCMSKDTVIISAKPLPVFSLGADRILCEREVLNLTVSLNNAIYTWSTGSQSNAITINSENIYWVDVTQNGCTKRDSIIIDYKPSPSVDLGANETLCEGDTKTLDASYAGATYLWSNNSTGPTMVVRTPGNYSVTVDLDGCIAKDTIGIAYDKKPVFTLGGDLAYCEGQQLILDPKLSNVTYLWSNGSTQPTLTVTSVGTYDLTATNHCGSSSDEIIVEKGICKLMLPSAFTPNGDGNNETFGLKYPGFIKEFHMIVYNRWGQKVFETKDPAKSWDGKFAGAEQSSDNYVWMINYTDLDGIKAFAKGYVLLIR